MPRRFPPKLNLKRKERVKQEENVKMGNPKRERTGVQSFGGVEVTESRICWKISR